MTMLPRWLDGEKTQNEGVVETRGSHDQKLFRPRPKAGGRLTKGCRLPVPIGL